MAVDTSYPMAAQALVPAADSPYDTPVRGNPHQSQRQTSSSPFSTYSASISLNEDSIFTAQTGTMELGEENKFNIRDPRRFTPDLGMSLVSQIHTLKKDIEGRDTLISSLEEALQQTRAENDVLTEELKTQRNEVTSVKSQMSSLERDMLQALEDIAKERDDAAHSVGEIKKLLQVSRRKVRSLEDETNKTRLQCEKEKQEWSTDKSKLESKVYVVEERLKTMVAEMMAVHSTGQQRPGTAHDTSGGVSETWPVRGNDDGAISRLSNTGVDDHHENQNEANFRASRISGLHEMGGSQMSGLSLADELEMTEDNSDDGEADELNIYSPDALPEEIAMISRRYSEDQKARKVMGFLADNDENRVGNKILAEEPRGIAEDYINFSTKHTAIKYPDMATQSTPPPKIAVQPKRTNSTSEKPNEQLEHSANQGRKRVATPSMILEQSSNAKFDACVERHMISISCQTEEPPKNEPMAQRMTNELRMRTSPSTQEMRSTSTQTVEDITTVSKPAGTRISPGPLDVPVIAIHPPPSRPPSSHNSVVLPPRTRNAGCQAVIEPTKNTTSTAMQTQEIRIDRRPARIPPRLQSTGLANKASSRSTDKRVRTSRPIPPQSPRRRPRNPSPALKDREQTSFHGQSKSNTQISSPVREIEGQTRPSLHLFGHTFPGINDHGSSESRRGLDSRQSGGSVDNFASFEASHEDIKATITDEVSDDDDFIDIEPIRKTLSKVQNSWKLVPQSENCTLGKSDLVSEKTTHQKISNASQSISTEGKDLSSGNPKSFRAKPAKGHQINTSAAKPPDIRRKALVSNGIAEHIQRARSPSAPDGFGREPPVVAPPFPVPTRSSSRKIPMSASEGAASPTPYTTSFFTARRGQDHGRPPIKRKILRKVQSAAAVPKAPERRPPPPLPSMSASSTVLASPKSLPQARNQFILPYDKVAELPHSVEPIPQSRSQTHAGEASIEAPRQQTSVVDAIAQTMVGEWMWKYVRKRTSFGITENPQTEFEMGRNGETGNSSGIRHKRWVWLAPYENAIIWSSKQPNSGPALLGKGGRKLMIQSVLDVKDDNPLPKNAGPQTAFDRSILILTPQRALKFTAISQERHYIWLTALSFLSHSTRGMDDLDAPRPLPQQEYQRPPSQKGNANFQRTPVRDSIRVAKARSRPSIGAHSFSSPIGEVEQRIVTDRAMNWGEGEPESEDAAEPPQVPRVAIHARKRSSTGPRPVPLSAFHSYPANGTAAISSFSLQAPTSREKYDRLVPGLGGASASGPNTMHTTMTRRTTNPNRDGYIYPPPVVPDNFFDPAGTMRMEAFVVGDCESEGSRDRKRDAVTGKKQESRSYRTRQGRKKDLSYWGVEETAGGRGAEGGRTGEEDLFTGF